MEGGVLSRLRSWEVELLMSLKAMSRVGQGSSLLFLPDCVRGNATSLSNCFRVLLVGHTGDRKDSFYYSSTFP